MQTIAIDAADLRILECLQRDARASNVQLAAAARLSASQCQRRVKRLEAAGIITGYEVRLDAKALGLGITAFVHVTLDAHNVRPAAEYARDFAALPEIQESYILTGDTDFLLRVVVPGLEDLTHFLMHTMMQVPGIGSVKTSVVLDEIRRSGALPLGHLRDSL